MLQIILLYIQRNQSLKIWKERLTIIPPTIMKHIMNMHDRYLRYCDTYGIPQYFPKIDDGLFQQEANLLKEYVLSEDGLFKKPYIAFIAMIGSDTFVFISINASEVPFMKPFDPSKLDDNPHKGKVAGYIYFDAAHKQSTAMTDGDCIFSFNLQGMCMKIGRHQYRKMFIHLSKTLKSFG
jgi:hypothetical protein